MDGQIPTLILISDPVAATRRSGMRTPKVCAESPQPAFRPSEPSQNGQSFVPRRHSDAHLAPSALRAGILASLETSSAHLAPSALRAGTKKTHQCTHEITHPAERADLPAGTCRSFSTRRP